MKRFPLILTVSATVGCATPEPGTTPLPGCVAQQPLTDADFVGGLVLDEGTCWRVEEDLGLSDGTVTIRRGVEIALAAGVRVRVQSDGQLRMAGTEVDPVVWTTGDPRIGWVGIDMGGSQGSDNVWEHAVIENAGSDNWNGAAWSGGAVFLEPDTTLTLDHVTIRGSASHGLLVREDVDLQMIATTLQANDVPAFVHPDVAGAIGGDTRFLDNTNPWVRVVYGNGDAVEADQTWAALEVPWRVEDRFFVDSALALAPGATVTFTPGASLRIRNGSLEAAGTAEAPIVLRGTSEARGSWQGLAVDSLGDALGVGLLLDHVEIADAGSDDWTGRQGSSAAVWLDGPSSASITNTTFRRHERYGVWASDEARLDAFGDNTFTDGGRAMFLHPDRVGELDGTSVISGNDLDRVDVVMGNTDALSADASWPDLGVPYHVRDRFFVVADLTLDAGVTLEMAGSVRIVVDEGGHIDAVGTAADPVVLQGADADPDGSWVGVDLGSTEPSTFTHARVLHTGSDAFTGDAASVAAFYVSANAALDLTDVEIGPGAGYGAYLHSASSDLTCSGVTFTDLDGAAWDNTTDTVLPGC